MRQTGPNQASETAQSGAKSGKHTQSVSRDYYRCVSTSPDPLKIALFNHAARGEQWEPDGCPTIPAAWIRDLVVTGNAGDSTVHAKGVRVRSVTLTGVLDFENAALKVPLVLDDVNISEPVNLEQAHGGAVRITGSQLAGFSAEQLHLEHSLDLSKSRINGPVTLRGSQIGGDLDCSGATFRNPDGKALDADWMRVTGSVLLCDRFQAEGEVWLVGAIIDGDLDCSGATFRNPGLMALVADRMRVTGSVFLCDRFQAEGEVRFSSATIVSNLECTTGMFRNPDGMALFGQALTVTGGLLWRNVCDVAGKVVLSSAKVGDLVDDRRSWQFEDMTYYLGGLRIDRFEGLGADWKWQQRRDWLVEAHEPSTSPYEMVARWYRSVGRNHDARHIGIAKQDARTANLARWPKTLHWAWRWLAGYGYQPWRAALALLLIYAVGVAVFSFFSEMILAQPEEVYGFNPLVYSADVVVPLVDLKQAAQWAPADTFGLATMYLLMGIGWGLSLALVAAVSVLYAQHLVHETWVRATRHKGLTQQTRATSGGS